MIGAVIDTVCSSGGSRN